MLHLCVNMFILYLFPWERILKDGYKHFWKSLHSSVRRTISITVTVRFKKLTLQMHHYLSLSDNLTTGKFQMFQSKKEAKRRQRLRLAKSHFAMSARTPSSCRQLFPLKSNQKGFFFKGFLKNATSRCHPELFHACCLFSEQRKMPLPTLPKQDGILPSALWGQGHSERHFEHDSIACSDFTAQGIQLPETLWNTMEFNLRTLRKCTQTTWSIPELYKNRQQTQAELLMRKCTGWGAQQKKKIEGKELFKEGHL